jgi:uncharacterized protein DUF397
MSDFSNAKWHKSARSSTGACVEVATLERGVGVRDSKDRQGPILVFRFDEWIAFLGGVRDGEFDIISEHLATGPTEKVAEQPTLARTLSSAEPS